MGRLHIGTLMAKMGITALYRKPNTSQRHQGHKIYPYLLRHLAIERVNHVRRETRAVVVPIQGCGLLYRRGHEVPLLRPILLPIQ